MHILTKGAALCIPESQDPGLLCRPEEERQGVQIRIQESPASDWLRDLPGYIADLDTWRHAQLVNGVATPKKFVCDLVQSPGRRVVPLLEGLGGVPLPWPQPGVAHTHGTGSGLVGVSYRSFRASAASHSHGLVASQLSR